MRSNFLSPEELTSLLYRVLAHLEDPTPANLEDLLNDCQHRIRLLKKETAPEQTTVERYLQIAQRARELRRINKHALLAYRGEGDPITLTLGMNLNRYSRPGALLAQLLAKGGTDPFTIISVRPGGSPRTVEHDIATRFYAAARLVDLPLDGVLLVAGTKTYELGQKEEP